VCTHCRFPTYKRRLHPLAPGQFQCLTMMMTTKMMMATMSARCLDVNVNVDVDVDMTTGPLAP